MIEFDLPTKSKKGFFEKSSQEHPCIFKPKDLKKYIDTLRGYLNDESAVVKDKIQVNELKAIAKEIQFWEHKLNILQQLNLL